MPIGARTELFAKWLQSAMVISDMSLGDGDRWFVDPSNTRGGATSGFGASPDKPFTTMAAALAACSDGDTIMLLSQLTEGDLVLSKSRVRILGVNPCPDANIWMESAKEHAYLLKVTGEFNLFRNIRFRGPRSDAPAATKGICLQLAGATGMVIENCNFLGRAGASSAIDILEGSDEVRISNGRFLYFNTAVFGHAISDKNNAYVADEVSSGMTIENCFFHSNLNHVVLRLRQANIHGNMFAEQGLGPAGAVLVATSKLVLAGGANVLWNNVYKNYMLGDYSNAGGYTAGASDNWFGNVADDTGEAEVSAEGVTIAIPAA